MISSMSKNSISHQSFVCTQIKYQTVLFDPSIGLYQVLSNWVINLSTMAMKGVVVKGRFK